MVGIVDEALAQGRLFLKIPSYKDALVDFIKRTDTPMVNCASKNGEVARHLY